VWTAPAPDIIWSGLDTCDKLGTSHHVIRMSPDLEGELSPSKERHAMLPFWNRLSHVHGLRSMLQPTPAEFVGMRPLLSLAAANVEAG
jgi:hypothetical protein